MRPFKAALNNRYIVYLFTVFIVLIGIYSFINMPRRVDPYLTPRVIQITFTNRTMSSEALQTQVGLPMERAIRKLKKIKETDGWCHLSKCKVTVQLDDSVFASRTYLQRIRETVDQLPLPKHTQVQVSDTDYARVPVTVLALTYNNQTNLDSLKPDAERIQNTLLNNPNIEHVSPRGIPYRGIEIAINTKKLSRYHLTTRDIKQLILNHHTKNEAVSIENPHLNLTTYTKAQLKTIDELKNLKVKLKNTAQYIHLKDIADISTQTIPTRMSGTAWFYDNHTKQSQKAILFPVIVKNRVNQNRVGKQIKQMVSEINKTLPQSLHLNIATYRPNDITRAFSSFTTSFLMSLLAVLLVLFICVNTRASIILTATLGIIVLAGGIVMYLTSIQLERMTYAGIIIALGLLIDNSVVYLLRVQTRINAGESIQSALVAANKRLTGPLLVAQITTILAFVPALLTHNKMTQFINAMPATIIIMLIVATICRFFILPTLCLGFLKPTKNSTNNTGTKSRPSFIMLQKILTQIIRFRIVVILLFLSTIPLAYLAYKHVQKKFYVPAQSSLLFVYIDSPNIQPSLNTMTNRYDTALKLITRQLSHLDVKNIITTSNFSRFKITRVQDTGASKNGLRFIIKSKQYISHTNVVKECKNIKQLLQHNSLGMILGRCESGTALPAYDEAEFEIKIPYNSTTTRHTILDVVKTYIAAHPKIHINYVTSEEIPSVVFTPNQARMHYAGITTEQLQQYIETYLSGPEFAYFYNTDQIVPLFIRSTWSAIDSPRKFRNLQIFSSKLKQSFPLDYFAPMKFESKDTYRSSYNAQPVIKIGGYSTSVSENTIRQALTKKISEAVGNEKFEVTNTFGQARIKETNKTLISNAFICITLIILTLLIGYRSIRKLLITLIVFPTACLGAFLGLIISGEPFGFLPSVGLIALFGIMINNSIYLMSAIDFQRNEQKNNLHESLINAVKDKAKAIFVTSATTVLALAPLYVFVDDFWRGTIALLIGGISMSSLVILCGLPVFYSVLFRDKKPVESSQPR
jgi:multidrug efflux pump